MPLDYHYLGDVQNVDTQTCLDTMGRRTGENVGISYCHGLGGNQVSTPSDTIHVRDEHLELNNRFKTCRISGVCLYETATNYV